MNVAKQSNGNLDLNGFQKSSKTLEKSISNIKEEEIM